MSAIDDLKAKPKVERTALEWAILVCDEMGGEATAADAAQELKELRLCVDHHKEEATDKSFRDRATWDYKLVYDFANSLPLDVRLEYFRGGRYLVPSLINYCRHLQSGS